MKGIVIAEPKHRWNHIDIEINEFIKKSNSEHIKFNNYDDYKKIPVNIEKHLSKNWYDFISIWYYEDLLEKLAPLYELGLPVIMHTGDCWNRLFDGGKFKSIVNKHKPNILIVENYCSINAFKKYLDDDDIKYVWLPHSFNPEIMKDYGKDKKFDVSFSGKFSNYTDRLKLHKYFMNRIYNGDNIKYKRLKSTPTLSGYAKNLNKSWISFNSMQNESLLYYKDIFIGNCFSKNFEISACKACLLNRKFGDAEDLGYKDGINCILYDNIEDMEEKVNYYLDNKDILSKIIDKGYELAHNKHTVYNHVDNLIEQLDKVL